MQKRKIVVIKPPKLEKIRKSPFCYRTLLPGEEGAGRSGSELVESVRRSGVMIPPLLTPSGTIILGHRRLAAASAAGLKEIEVMLPDPASDREVANNGIDPSFQRICSDPGKSTEIEDPATFVPFWLEDALQGEELSELEKIIIVKKALGFFPKDPFPVLASLSKIFGRTLSAGAFREITAFLDKDQEVLEALHRGYVKTADLLQLSSRRKVDLTQAVRFLSEKNLSRAEQKGAVRLIAYLADQGEGKWEIFAAEHEKSGGSFSDSLRTACYPALTGDSRAIDEIISGIRLPQHAKISPPCNLEGGAYMLNIKIRDEEKLVTALEKIRSALEDGKIAALLEILKGRTGR